jgi:hypothetical protein
MITPPVSADSRTRNVTNDFSPSTPQPPSVLHKLTCKVYPKLAAGVFRPIQMAAPQRGAAWEVSHLAESPLRGFY